MTQHSGEKQGGIGAPARLEQLLDLYAGDGVCVAGALCDEHPGGDLALTIVEADLTTRQVTFRELRERSEGCAGGLAHLGVGPVTGSPR